MNVHPTIREAQIVQLGIIDQTDMMNKVKEIKSEPPDTTNILVTKFVDPAADLMEVDSGLDLNNKGKLIEVELLHNSQLQNIENKNLPAFLSKLANKKGIKRKDGTENKLNIINDKPIKKKKRLCSQCGEERLKNHDLLCKADADRKTLQSVGPALCSKCGKHFSSKFNLKRHMTSCKLCPEDEKGPRYICQCGRTYSQEWDMKKHKVRCKDVKKKCKPCVVENCHLLFYHKAQLVSHMKRDHLMKIDDPIVLSFSCFDDFLSWKEKEEEETYTYYSKQTGSNVTGISVNTYYVCQRDGSERAHNSSPRKTERKNKKGRIKTGRLCWAQMNVKQFKDGTVKVTYFPSHTHPLSVADTKHHPLPLSVTMEIKRRLSGIETTSQEGSVENHLQELKKGRKKKYGVTLRALKSLARKNRNLFRITNEAVQQSNCSSGLQEENSRISKDTVTEICSNETQAIIPNYVIEPEENVDDPGEITYLEHKDGEENPNSQEEENIVDLCLHRIETLKEVIVNGKLQKGLTEELSETLQFLINKYKESVEESTTTPSLNEVCEQSDVNLERPDSFKGSTDVNSLKLTDLLKEEFTSNEDDSEKTVYQILTLDNKEKTQLSNNEFLFQNAVELVGAREFIIISADHAQYIQTLDPAVQFEIN